MSHNFTIAQTWEGVLVQPEDRVHVDIAIWNNDRLQIEIIAPFYKKNASPTDEVKLQGQPPTWKLWEYDVVEIFFVCANGNYIETEFGPHGHYLILELDAPRKIVRRDIICNYKTKFFGSRWKGFAEIPLSVFPDNIEKINLFAIFGYSQQTEYIFKAIQVKKEEMQSLQKQNPNGTITFRGKHLYPTEKNASVQPAQTIEPTKGQIPSDSEGAFHGSMDTTQDQLSDNLGSKNERIHLIWSSLEGETPDFHQPELFPPCPDLRNPID